MPIVFVHGVNVRDNGSAYDHQVAARNTFLKEYVLPTIVTNVEQTQIFNPYWGGLAAKLAWNHASLPDSDQETFGGEDSSLATLIDPQALTNLNQGNAALAHLARQSLRDVVDLVFAQSIRQARTEELAELIALAAKANNYAEQNSTPPWLSQVNDDQAFYNQLRQAVDAWQPVAATVDDQTTLTVIESFGVVSNAWNAVRRGFTDLRQSFGRVTGQVTRRIRQPLHRSISIFLGDVFKYIQDRGSQEQPGPITDKIITKLTEAANLRTDDDPLIVIAHSMGGNICFDIFSHFQPNLAVDAFITVGSQVSLFAELKLYKERFGGLPVDPEVDRIPKPNNVAHWLNIFDPNDVLSFACEGVFADVADFEFVSGGTLLSAHSAYFERTSFYQRLAYRVGRLLT